METISLHKEISQYLEQSSMSQTEFARRCDISKSYLSNILAGRRSPRNIELLQRIAGVTGNESIFLHRNPAKAGT